MCRHLVRNGETIQAGFFHRVHLDGESRVAACFGTPRHGQSVEPLHQARDGPVKVPRRLDVIRTSSPLGMRSLRKRKGACAAQAPPPPTGESRQSDQCEQAGQNLSFRARDMTEMSVAAMAARDAGAWSIPHCKVCSRPARSKQTGPFQGD